MPEPSAGYVRHIAGVFGIILGDQVLVGIIAAGGQDDRIGIDIVGSAVGGLNLNAPDPAVLHQKGFGTGIQASVDAALLEDGVHGPEQVGAEAAAVPPGG